LVLCYLLLAARLQALQALGALPLAAILTTKAVLDGLPLAVAALLVCLVLVDLLNKAQVAPDNLGLLAAARLLALTLADQV
jgi:hypothetical protein